jgi:hypothetical protein
VRRVQLPQAHPAAALASATISAGSTAAFGVRQAVVPQQASAVAVIASFLPRVSASALFDYRPPQSRADQDTGQQ